MSNKNERSRATKYAGSIAIAAASLWLAGCASAPNVAVIEPVGPAPSEATSAQGDGSLVVLSARAPAHVDINAETWAWNNDFGKNEFMYQAAHSGYTVYDRNGQVVKRVSNARDPNDDTPSLVNLPQGSYRVEAEAINCDGRPVSVILPVVVKAGQTTMVHLEGDWNPAGAKDAEFARLPCGRIIGWRASAAEVASR
jgi:hypothetical protein